MRGRVALFALRWSGAIRGTVAVAGLGVIVVLVAALWVGASHSTAVWHVFLLWCVGVPYWHYLEYRFLLDPAAGARARDDFLAQQVLSRTVWLGVGLLLGVSLLRG